MAEKKMTNAMALTQAVETLRVTDEFDPTALEILEHMVEVANRPKKKSNEPSKNVLKNRNLGAQVYEIMLGHEPMNAKAALELIHANGIDDDKETGIASTQKLIAILDRYVLGAYKEKTKDGVMYHVVPDDETTIISRDNN